ncbi:C-type lectin domain family 4 member C-like [Leucoraja erinacea]|uniref:C-type lectin domain family 4 member C-like n=1 Tax=Leucoraja erinaceus TaxID=7782 RepID=UPI002455AAA8|nr:C-type lectin domain family 4 member C-like [Leucoraja erinacea]
MTSRTSGPTTSRTSGPTSAHTISRTSGPTTSRTSAHMTSPTSAPTTSRTSAAMTSRTSAPTTSPTSAPVISRTSAPVTSRTSAALTSRTSAPVTSRTSAAVTSRTSVPVTSRTSAHTYARTSSSTTTSVPAPAEADAPASRGLAQFGTNWSRLALATLAVCGMLAISVLVLQIEGSKLLRNTQGKVAERDAMVNRTHKLQDEMTGQDAASKCSKYEELFLHWLSAFCKVANCTSELCHKSWVPFEGHCYYFSKELLDWDKSRQECIDQGSELLVVRNKKEQKFAGSHDPQSVFWIGLRELPHLLSWRWIDGSPLLDDVTFWDKGYPDSYFDYEMEDFKFCVGMRNNAWVNMVCAATQRRICKRRTEKLPVNL